MKKNNDNYHGVQHCIVVPNNQIILLHRKNTTYEKNVWAFPSGSVEKNESFLQAVQRETREETDIFIPLEKIQFIKTQKKITNKRIEHHHYFLTILDYIPTLRNNEVDKCDGLDFFPYGVLQENFSSHVQWFFET